MATTITKKITSVPSAGTAQRITAAVADGTTKKVTSVPAAGTTQRLTADITDGSTKRVAYGGATSVDDDRAWGDTWGDTWGVTWGGTTQTVVGAPGGTPTKKLATYPS